MTGKHGQVQWPSWYMVLNWLVGFRFNATLTAKVISWQLVTHIWLSHTSTDFSFQSHRLLFSHASAGERRKYARKKSRLNQGSNSQPPGHQSDTLTTKPLGWGPYDVEIMLKWY